MDEKLSLWQQVHLLVDPEARSQHAAARLTQAQDEHLNQPNLYEDESHDLQDDQEMTAGPCPPMRAVGSEETVRFILQNVNFYPN